MTIASINPATNETVRTFEPLNESQIEKKLHKASLAFRENRGTSFTERATALLRAANILESEKNNFARLMTLEMGKPIKAAVQESEKCAWVCRYYSEKAEGHLSDQEIGRAHV